MRKIVMFNRVSIDGYFSGPNGEIDWFVQDPEVDRAAHERMDPDTIFYGRETYELFECFWPHAADDGSMPAEVREVAEELNRMTKVVFSRTLQSVSWMNAVLAKGDIIKAVRGMKDGEGADIVIFGSGSIVRQLANEGLIDEYLIVVTPIVLGAGKSMFNDVNKMKLRLLETVDFRSGNVMHHYALNE